MTEIQTAYQIYVQLLSKITLGDCKYDIIYVISGKIDSGLVWTLLSSVVKIKLDRIRKVRHKQQRSDIIKTDSEGSRIPGSRYVFVMKLKIYHNFMRVNCLNQKRKVDELNVDEH